MGKYVPCDKALDVLYLGAGVAIFIVALTVYLRFGSGHNHD